MDINNFNLLDFAPRASVVCRAVNICLVTMATMIVTMVVTIKVTMNTVTLAE